MNKTSLFFTLTLLTTNVAAYYDRSQSLTPQQIAIEELFDAVTSRDAMQKAIVLVRQTGADINAHYKGNPNHSIHGSTVLTRFVWMFALWTFNSGTDMACPIDIFNDLLAAGANPLKGTAFEYEDGRNWNDLFACQRDIIDVSLQGCPYQQQWMAELYLDMALNFIEKTPYLPREKCIEILQYAKILAAKPVLNDREHSPENYKKLLREALTLLDSYRETDGF